ncbi:type VI secretion system baseplate subunit TssG [Pseudovibrio ascidiaceicola]|uniref:type VI secretion system baseplate subunit TssG n=1 Tax=Pseudovibrio ascidiaceicola TaxID=285279 RepID=UPI000D68C9B7|nr:type VI secretion system baseplate subunit TssG [Pseudovibrio ascidiaceicola]
MASENWATTSDLRGDLQFNARSWSFFQAVELIQRCYDERTEVGTHLLPKDEKINFSVMHSLGFPLSDIASIERQDNQRGDVEPVDYVDFNMEVTFLGLHGSSSPLPSYYQEVIAKYDAQGSLMKGFFDFFHNRLVGLLHRSMRKYRFYVRYEPGALDPFSQWVFCVFGLSDQESRHKSPINWARLLTFAGVLASRNRSPAAIASVVSHSFFHKEVEVEEWVQRRVDIPEGQRSELGQYNMLLGEDTIIGDSVSDISSKFNIFIKNLSFERFQDFLPHGRDYKALRDLVEFMLRDQHAYDIKLELAENQASPVMLTDEYEGRLGWSTFLDKGDGRSREVLISARL